MALFFYKHENMMEVQNINQFEFESNINFSQKNLTPTISKRLKEPIMMLDGINLGDIMRQTVMEEMRRIQMENGQSMQRMEGSWGKEIL